METKINLYDDTGWEKAVAYPSGTRKKVLHDKENVKTILLKLPAGFSMAGHAHIYEEQHFLLKGEFMVDGKLFREGSFQSFKAHETHGPFKSENGALVLVIWTTAWPQ